MNVQARVCSIALAVNEGRGDEEDQEKIDGENIPREKDADCTYRIEIHIQEIEIIWGPIYLNSPSRGFSY